MPTIDEDEPKSIDNMKVTNEKEQKNLTNTGNIDEYYTGSTRTAGVAPGGVDGPGKEVNENTDVQGRWRFTGSAGVATSGVDAVGKAGRPGNKTDRTDVKGP